MKDSSYPTYRTFVHDFKINVGMDSSLRNDCIIRTSGPVTTLRHIVSIKSQLMVIQGRQQILYIHYRLYISPTLLDLKVAEAIFCSSLD